MGDREGRHNYSIMIPKQCEASNTFHILTLNILLFEPFPIAALTAGPGTLHPCIKNLTYYPLKYGGLQHSCNGNGLDCIFTAFLKI
jgi:hypothetical protein